MTREADCKKMKDMNRLADKSAHRVISFIFLPDCF